MKLIYSLNLNILHSKHHVKNEVQYWSRKLEIRVRWLLMRFINTIIQTFRIKSHIISSICRWISIHFWTRYLVSISITILKRETPLLLSCNSRNVEPPLPCNSSGLGLDIRKFKYLDKDVSIYIEERFRRWK